MKTKGAHLVHEVHVQRRIRCCFVELPPVHPWDGRILSKAFFFSVPESDPRHGSIA